jgi:glycosyltransferase involved in cell wall biosynthesis
MFDGNSWMVRKNPLAVIRAFEKAFPKSNQNVGLVIKVMNVNEQHLDWLEIKKIAAEDSRIIIKVVHLRRPEVMALIMACDCFVSLHRAEGFGRIIAESMLLGKPVIVTNFSGNTDFTNEKTAFLVNGPMIPLKKGDYSVWENQYWCDPDVDEAAKQMQVCFENKKLREDIASAGQHYIQTHHSAKTVGEAYRARLKVLGVIE